jgi:hypothetical protein
MSTFFSKSRNPGDAKETSEAASPGSDAQGKAEVEASPMPPFVAHGGATGGAGSRTTPTPVATAPGVVPPAAAPVYSVPAAATLPRSIPPLGSVPHSVPPAGAIPLLEAVAENPLTRSMTMASEAQENLQATLQRRRAVAVRAPDTSMSLVRRPAPTRTRRARPRPRMPFDPEAYAQTGLLNLAYSWQQAGASVRAIHTYMQVLIRYPGTSAADAAVADLVEFADTLAEEGHFHTALSIYDQLEELV